MFAFFRPPKAAETEYPVQIRAGEANLHGDLIIPESPSGIVLFSHGSGSSRLSTRNRYVARMLRDSRLATLLFDLLTGEEEIQDAEDAHLRFDIGLLTRRLVVATDWVLSEPSTARLPIGYFGASTGAASALAAAVERPDAAKAIVSRGGRPDLALEALPRVRAPTLLIVGGRDNIVLQLNRQALGMLRSEKKLEIVPGATHLFEEPGALDHVGRLAADWFTMYLKG